MTFIDAIKLLKAHKCVRRHQWNNKDFLYYVSIRFSIHRYCSLVNMGFPYDILQLSNEDLSADDWEEVTKRRIK